MKNIQRTDKDTQRQWVHKTFSTYKPEYHITICWKDKPSSDTTASGHLKVTKNLMNRLLTGVSTCSDIPDFPERPGSLWFHEVSLMTEYFQKRIPRQRMVFHTQGYLCNTKGRFKNDKEVTRFIKENCVPRIKNLQTLNKGLKVVPYVEEHHLDYHLDSPKKKKDIPHYFAQGSGYAVMWEERTGMPITNVVILMDVDNFHPIVYKEHRDNHIDLLLDTKQEYDRRNIFK